MSSIPFIFKMILDDRMYVQHKPCNEHPVLIILNMKKSSAKFIDSIVQYNHNYHNGLCHRCIGMDGSFVAIYR